MFCPGSGTKQKSVSLGWAFGIFQQPAGKPGLRGVSLDVGGVVASFSFNLSKWHSWWIGKPPFSVVAPARRRGLPQIAHPISPYRIAGVLGAYISSLSRIVSGDLTGHHWQNWQCHHCSSARTVFAASARIRVRLIRGGKSGLSHFARRTDQQSLPGNSRWEKRIQATSTDRPAKRCARREREAPGQNG